MIKRLALLGFVGMLALQIMTGCGSSGTSDTTTTTVATTTTTTVSTTSTTTTSTTTTSTSTTTTTILYRIMGIVNNGVGNPSIEVGVVLYKNLVSGEAGLTREVGDFSGGVYNYNLVTTEAGTYWLVAMSPWYSSSHYFGGPGITSESMSGLHPVTVEAGTLILTVETFGLYLLP